MSRVQSNIFFLVLVNLLIKPLFIFGIDIPVQNRVGEEAYGYYFALFNLAFLFNMVLDFGVNTFTQRVVARNPDRVQAWLPSVLLLKSALALVFFALVMLVGAGLRLDADQFRLLAWICLNRILISYHMYFRANVSGLQAFRLDAMLSISDRFLTILVVGALLYTDVLGRAFEIQDFVLSTTASLLLTASISWISLRWKNGIIKLQWDPRVFKLVLLRAYPYALLGVLMTLYNRIDGVMLERLLGDQGDTQAGIYAAAYRLLDAATMFAFLISGILLPLFSRLIKERTAIWPMARMGARLMYAVSMAAGLACSAFAGPIMDLLYINADAYWHKIFALLIFGFVFNSSVYVFGSLLTAGGYLRGLNIIALSGVLLNIILNLILIPREMAMGAALATVVTQGLVALAHIIYAARQFKISSELLAELPRWILYTAVLLGLRQLLLQSSLPWITGFGIMAATALILSLVLGMIQWKAWKEQA